MTAKNCEINFNNNYNNKLDKDMFFTVRKYTRDSYNYYRRNCTNIFDILLNKKLYTKAKLISIRIQYFAEFDVPFLEEDTGYKYEDALNLFKSLGINPDTKVIVLKFSKKDLMPGRIITNIVSLDKLYTVPCCDKWFDRFVDGKIDAHKAFIEYGKEYHWLYENSPYDLVGWEVINDCFDWFSNSRYVAQYRPDFIEPNKHRYNWKRHSWAVALYCPEKLKFKPEGV